MKPILNIAGSIAGVLGVLLCMLSGAARVSGSFYVADFEATTLFSVGVGLMVFACLLKLEVLLRGR